MKTARKAPEMVNRQEAQPQGRVPRALRDSRLRDEALRIALYWHIQPDLQQRVAAELWHQTAHVWWRGWASSGCPARYMQESKMRLIESAAHHARHPARMISLNKNFATPSIRLGLQQARILLLEVSASDMRSIIHSIAKVR